MKTQESIHTEIYGISSLTSRAMFSVYDTKVWETFSRETRFGFKPRVWDSKTSTIANLMYMQNDRKFCDCSALYATCFKIVMTTTYVCMYVRM